MKRSVIAVSGLALFMAILVFGVSAVAQNVKPGTTGDMGDMPAMMQKSGMSPEMAQRCQVMMGTRIFMDSPGALYQQAEALGLSAKQMKKLVKIRDEARQKALKVLSAEQRKKVEEISSNPMAMRQMCEQMMPMMKKMMGGKGMGGQMMMCPMTGGGGASQGSSKKSGK